MRAAKSKKDIWYKIEEGLQKVLSIGEGNGGSLSMDEYMAIYK
jgi:hypothetical protein